MHRFPKISVLPMLCAVAPSAAFAQASPASRQLIIPSVFAGVTGVETGLLSGTNLSITAGIDLAFRPIHKLQPALEYRATYALAKGQIDSLDSDLGGVKLAAHLGRLNPYADFLAGRGETTYANNGIQVPNKLTFYTQSSSNVFSPGGGIDIFATSHLALKVDVQFQRYSSPVTASGHIYSETGLVGVVYIFHLGRKLI